VTAPAAHDPELCGLDADGRYPVRCPGCQAEIRSGREQARSELGAELVRIATRWQAADRREKATRTLPDFEQAAAESMEAEDDFWSCKRDLADLFLLLLRCACEVEPEAVHIYVAELLTPEIDFICQRLAARKGIGP
jgi:hypothetical protein